MAGFITKGGRLSTKNELLNSFYVVMNYIDSLSSAQLMEFAREVQTHPFTANVTSYSGSKGVVKTILDAYDSRVAKGVGEEVAYADGKKGSLLSIFKKNYIPNLIGFIARM